MASSCASVRAVDQRVSGSLAFGRKRHQSLDSFEDLVEFRPIGDVCGPALAIDAIGFFDAGTNGLGRNFGTH
jgi:hypothetical protein